ncbi:DUF2927 domain-containing protein, partial [Bradyrhizobium sp.]|uniref:DUF2927 domain-containing protein n=1 Tax=Bradyrhizobium sp. TaxID=376 RepID=UPI003C1F3449
MRRVRRIRKPIVMALAALLPAGIGNGPAKAENPDISSRRASERTDFTNDEIRDGFFKIALHPELQLGQPAERVRKFDEPVRIFLDNKGSPDRRSEIAAVVDDIRSRVDHLDVGITNDRRAANFVVTLVSGRDFSGTIRSLYGRERAKQIEQSLAPQCLSGIGKDKRFRIRRAEVILPVDAGEFTFFDCAYEELLQALGAINDDRSVPWTMFNDDVQILTFAILLGLAPCGRGWRGERRRSGRAWSRLEKGQRLHEVVPRGEDQEGSDRIQVAEESASRPELLPGRAPEFVGDVADGVNGEGEQVQGSEDGGEVELAVAEVVLDIIPLGLENVEGFVLDLPSGTTAGGELGDVVGADREVGDEAVVVGDFASGVDDLDLEPVDDEGILAVAQGNIGEPAVAIDGVLLAALDLLFVGRKVDPGDVFGNQRMGGWLADEDEIPVDVAHGLAQRLAGEQVVTKKDRIEPCVARAVGGQPSLGRGVLAVLLFRAILRRDEFRLERDNLVVSGRDQCRPEHRMEILGLSFAAQPGRAMPTMDVLGAEIFRSIQGDQHMIPQPTKSIQAVGHRFQRRDRIGKHRMKPFRLCRIQHVANMVVAGDLGDPEQALAVRTPVPLLQPQLMRQKRGALHEKHRERRHPDVAHRVGHVRSSALVRKCFQAPSQRTEEGLKGPHPHTEADSRPFANPHSVRRVKTPHPRRRPSLSKHPSCNCDSFVLRTA